MTKSHKTTVDDVFMSAFNKLIVPKGKGFRFPAAQKDTKDSSIEPSNKFTLKLTLYCS